MFAGTHRASVRALFASVLLCTFRASLAVYAAAPVKLASALPRSRELVGVVAPTAAHQVASIGAFAGTIAISALRAETTLRQIRLAIIRGRLQIDELVSLRDPFLRHTQTTADFRLFQNQARFPRFAGLRRGLSIVSRLCEVVRFTLSFGVVAQYRYQFRRRGMRHRVQRLNRGRRWCCHSYDRFSLIVLFHERVADLAKTG